MRTTNVRTQLHKNLELNTKQWYREKTEERKCWYHVKRIGKVYGEKMELILAIWVDTIDKLGYKIGQASLLTYPDYVIFKGFKTVIDI